MNKIMAVNAGSSSLKYQLIDMTNEIVPNLLIVFLKNLLLIQNH